MNTVLFMKSSERLLLQTTLKLFQSSFRQLTTIRFKFDQFLVRYFYSRPLIGYLSPDCQVAVFSQKFTGRDPEPLT